jgi:ferredoxin
MGIVARNYLCSYNTPIGYVNVVMEVRIMEEKKRIIRKKAKVFKEQCVACGTCETECPIGAIKVVAGVFAKVDEDRCVGCSKCEKVCPASVIEIIEKEVVK